LTFFGPFWTSGFAYVLLHIEKIVGVLSFQAGEIHGGARTAVDDSFFNMIFFFPFRNKRGVVCPIWTG